VLQTIHSLISFRAPLRRGAQPLPRIKPSTERTRQFSTVGQLYQLLHILYRASFAADRPPTIMRPRMP